MKLMVVMGTRPEVIKLAPVVIEARSNGVETVCVVTAQHREMLDMMMNVFDLKADYDLDLMKENQTLAEITANVVSGVAPIVRKEKPDAVLVQGDTVTTFAGALVAFYSGVKVGHVEAGLRSGNMWSPFPEEMMRCLTTRLSEWNFCPTDRNKRNLLDEGVPSSKCFVTGNTVIDALNMVVKPSYEFRTEVLQRLDFSKPVIVLTMHRRENLGDTMFEVLEAIRSVVQKYDVELVFPVHKNPAVRKVVEAVFDQSPKIHLVEPLDYVEFANLLARCYMVVTDSGGVQEEAPFLGKPVVVLRRETERQETIEAGVAVLAGVEPDRVYEIMKILLTDRGKYERMAKAVSPYGDGLASKRIVDILLRSNRKT